MTPAHERDLKAKVDAARVKADAKEIGAAGAYVLTSGSYGRTERNAVGVEESKHYRHGDVVALNEGEVKALKGKISLPGTTEADKAVAWRQKHG
jgi:hypothetical protein